MIGIEHALFGEQIRTQANVFYVVEGCAGLRTLQSISFASVVYLDVLFRNRRQVALVLVAAFMIAIAVNLLRVLGIVLYPDSDWARDHTLQGLFMICLGVVLIAVFDGLLQRFEESGSERANDIPGARQDTLSQDQEDEPAAGRASVMRPRLAAMSVGILLYAGVGLATPSWSPLEERYPRAAKLAIRIDGWRAERTLLPDREFLGSVIWSDQVNRIYTRIDPTEQGSSAAFEVLILADDRLDRGKNILSTKTELARPGYQGSAPGARHPFPGQSPRDLSGTPIDRGVRGRAPLAGGDGAFMEGAALGRTRARSEQLSPEGTRAGCSGCDADRGSAFGERGSAGRIARDGRPGRSSDSGGGLG